MEIERQVGNYCVLIDCNEPHDIYFEQKYPLTNIRHQALSQTDICQMLSEDKPRPISLKWEITDKCNLSCPFCYIVGQSHNMIVRFKDIEEQLIVLLEEGLLYCTITGGEALTHPDFYDIYLFLRRNGVIVEIYTNGTCITDRYFDLFLKYKPSKIEVTIYGISDHVFKLNTNSKHSAECVLNNILKLKNCNLNVICKTPINKLTISELDSIIDWCSNNGIHHYHSSDIIRSYDSHNLLEYLVDPETKLKYDIENEIKLLAKHEAEVSGKIKKCFSCSAGAYGIHINSAFKLFPCGLFQNKITGFNILDSGVRHALQELRDFVSLTHNTNIIGCHGCRYSVSCKVCPAIAEDIITDGKLTGYAIDRNYCCNFDNEFAAVESGISAKYSLLK